MKIVLKYSLRGSYVGILSLLLIFNALIFTLVLRETESLKVLIPYLNAVHNKVVIPYLIPHADTTFITILNYYCKWALLVLLLPFVIGDGSGLIKKQTKKGATGSA